MVHPSASPLTDESLVSRRIQHGCRSHHEGSRVSCTRRCTHDTGRKREQASRRGLREAEEFAATVEQATDFIGIATPDGRAHYVNPAGLALMGDSTVRRKRGRRW